MSKPKAKEVPRLSLSWSAVDVEKNESRIWKINSLIIDGKLILDDVDAIQNGKFTPFCDTLIPPVGKVKMMSNGMLHGHQAFYRTPSPDLYYDTFRSSNSNDKPARYAVTTKTKEILPVTVNQKKVGIDIVSLLFDLPDPIELWPHPNVKIVCTLCCHSKITPGLDEIQYRIGAYVPKSIKIVNKPLCSNCRRVGRDIMCLFCWRYMYCSKTCRETSKDNHKKHCDIYTGANLDDYLMSDAMLYPLSLAECESNSNSSCKCSRCGKLKGGSSPLESELQHMIDTIGDREKKLVDKKDKLGERLKLIEETLVGMDKIQEKKIRKKTKSKTKRRIKSKGKR